MIFKRVMTALGRIAWFLPGFLLWAAYPPMGETTDALFALAPLMWLSRQGDAKKSARRWFQSGVFFWVATLAWMPAIVKNNGPWPLVVLGWAALAAYCAAYFAAYGYLSGATWAWVKEGGYARRIFAVVVVEPVLWCGLELVRSRFGGGFAWNQLGVALVNANFGAPAAIGGVYLCSAVVVLVNGTLAGIAERMMRKAPKIAAIETLAAFGVIFGIYGLTNLNAERETEGELKVALIQRNFPCCFKSPDENPIGVYSNLFRNVALFKPDLVVLPESAMSEFGALESNRAFAFGTQWALEKTGATGILAGGTRIGRHGELYNSAALYEYDRVSIYDKVHLVPFGEFIPGDKLLPVLQKYAPVGSCTAGKPKLLNFKAIPFGVAICFEDTDSALIREAAAKGAKFLCFITNDSWFSRSDEALAHAWQARARAIETGLPVVRVGNSGVTGTISARGEVNWLIGRDGKPLVDAEGSMFAKIKIAGGGNTLYTKLGDWPLSVAFSLLIITAIVVKYRHERAKRNFVSL